MSHPARTYRLLIVDDNPGDHRLFQEAITELAYPIVLVSCLNGLAALDHLATDAQFDVVLTDLNMPRMSGVELCAKIEAHPEWRTIPTIVMSSNPKRNLPAALASECRSPYFVKPTSWVEFIDHPGDWPGQGDVLVIHVRSLDNIEL